jgi:DNA-binding protein HU-beta
VNKAELIDALAARLGDKRAATQALDAVLTEVQNAVTKGDKVAITGFGVFEKKVRAARTARNPRTGEAVKVKKTSVPAFRPGAGFRELVASGKVPKVAAAKKTTAKAATATKTATKAAAKTTTARATATKAATKTTAKATKSTATKTATKAAPRKTTAKATKAAAAPTVRKTATAKATTAKATTAKATTKAAPAARKAPAKKR